jgi:hypothetical protein
MSMIYPAARIMVSLANISIAVIVILSVLPLVSDGFSVDVPEADDILWSFSGGSLTLTAPFGVTNGGFFDINDVEIAFSVSNQSGSKMLDVVNRWGTISSGTHVTRDINLPIDLAKLVEDGFGWMMLHSDRLVVKVTVTAKYTMKTILFTADREIQLPWDGLIQSYGFGQPALVNSSGSYSVQLPYYLDTADVLYGLSRSASFSLSNGTGAEISSATEQVALGKNHSSVLVLPISQQAAVDLFFNNQTLTAEIDVGISTGLSFTLIRSMEWTAPMHW